MSRPSVLIIEDDPALRGLEARLATAAGFEVHLAEDGAQGIAMAVQLRPQLIVTDYHLPGMKAPEILATIRRLPDLAAVPVLVATAEPPDRVGPELSRLGASGLISKPFQPQAFRKQLRDALGLDREPPPPAAAPAAPAGPSALVLIMAAAMESPGSTETDATLRHLRRVSLLGAALGQTLDLDPELVRGLAEYGPLHDIGKVSLPVRLVRGGHRFTAQERAEMESHTLLGAELLRQAGLPPVAHQIALYHHERWDGGGYPRGLSGEGIPLSARVIAAVDVYDAMRSHRPYRPDIPKDEVRRRVAELRGSHLDPRVVDALLRMDDVTENIFAEHGDPSAEPDPEVWR
jgi:putative two-component system response regulator